MELQYISFVNFRCMWVQRSELDCLIYPFISGKLSQVRRKNMRDVCQHLNECNNLLAAEAHSRAGEILVWEEGVQSHFVI